MLNKEELLRLNKQGQFDKIYNLFRNEYKSILKNFFTKNKIDVKNDYSLINLITRLNYVENGKYADISDYLSDMFLCDESTLASSISLAIDMYNYIYSSLSSK